MPKAVLAGPSNDAAFATMSMNAAVVISFF